MTDVVPEKRSLVTYIASLSHFLTPWLYKKQLFYARPDASIQADIWASDFGLNMLITKQTTIKEIISFCPEAVNFFNDLQMSCGSCFAVKFDTLESGALMHGMDVNDLVTRLNQFISSSYIRTELSSTSTELKK